MEIKLNGSRENANDLNNFYNRSDKMDFTYERLRAKEMFGSVQDDDFVLQPRRRSMLC